MFVENGWFWLVDRMKLIDFDVSARTSLTCVGESATELMVEWRVVELNWKTNSSLQSGDQSP